MGEKEIGVGERERERTEDRDGKKNDRQTDRGRRE